MATAQVLRPGPPGQPDIDYTPNLDKYRARVKRRKETEKLEKTLPEGFPKKLQSNLVWDGNDIVSRYKWTYELNEHEIEEIEDALNHFKCKHQQSWGQDDTLMIKKTTALNKPLGYISQETFPLPKLHDTLRNISHEIHHEYGFKVLRGLPVSRHTREENVIIYAGVSAHIAPILGRQDHQFEGRPADVALNHIKDMSSIVDASKIGAPAYTTEKQVFHTDAGDLIALLCLETASEGGQSKLSSSWKVYNELAETRPDLIRTLAEPWASEK